MNTGLVSTNLNAPTIVTLATGIAEVTIINNATSTGTLIYDFNATALAAASNSTLPIGGQAKLTVPNGIATLAFGTASGSVTADIQIAKMRV